MKDHSILDTYAISQAVNNLYGRTPCRCKAILETTVKLSPGTLPDRFHKLDLGLVLVKV